MRWLVRTDNGDIANYNRTLIETSIEEALAAAGEEGDAQQLALHVETDLTNRFFLGGDIPHTERIKDSVVAILRLYDFHGASERYLGSAVDEDHLIFIENLITEYVGQRDWRVNENSNMNYSLQGLNFHISSSIIARYWLNSIYPEDVKNAQNNGDIHIHDLGTLGPYCVGWDLQELLLSGFGGVPNKISSSPAKHFRAILGQVVNFLYTLQGEAAGAQAFSNFDTLLAPFIRFDKLSYGEVKQALQEFIFNLNVPTRVGFQAPFTNITMDLAPAPVLQDSPVIIGGQPQDITYADFQAEMTMINRAFAELMSEGDAQGRIFTFPIPTYNIHNNFDFDDPDLIPIWEMTGKYGIPYFSNFVNSDLNPDDVRSMCCRLRLDTKELRKRGGGLFGANPQTGSIGVVTINMPRLGYLAENEEDFFHRLDEMLEIARSSLEIKRSIVEQLTDQGLYPYTSVYLKSVKQAYGVWWANHFSTIGIIGMNEACENFLGMPITNSHAKKWTEKVLNHIRQRMQEFQVQTDNYYNLEASPAEGASHRLAKKDRELFGDNFAQGTDSVQYYTNSVHVPAFEDMDVFELLEHQDSLQTLFTGGTVVHLYLGEAITDPSGVKELVKAVVNQFRLPYFSITPTFSICPIHGYLHGKHFYCPFDHSDEELRSFGKDRELDTGEISQLNNSAYRLLEKK
ncbi:ribonucleoside triphosphate reductase [Myxococcota bacterium]|nr:ribonucleoside triphosphate reductase [Myxococcota bacterium]